MSIALVTGADGFIGSRLVELLVKKAIKSKHFLNIILLIIGAGLRILNARIKLKY